MESGGIAPVRSTVGLDLTPNGGPACLEQGPPVDGKITEVAGERLVSAATAEHHLDPVPRRGVPDIKADHYIQRMHWLVLVPQDAIELVPQSNGIDVDTMEHRLGTLDRLLDVG